VRRSPRAKASATGSTAAPVCSSCQGWAAWGVVKKWTRLQKAERMEAISSGVTIETTAVAGSTLVTWSGSTLKRTGVPERRDAGDLAVHAYRLHAVRPAGTGGPEELPDRLPGGRVVQRDVGQLDRRRDLVRRARCAALTVVTAWRHRRARRSRAPAAGRCALGVRWAASAAVILPATAGQGEEQCQAGRDDLAVSWKWHVTPDRMSGEDLLTRCHHPMPAPA
jgi:hypothetical protein